MSRSMKTEMLLAYSQATEKERIELQQSLRDDAAQLLHDGCGRAAQALFNLLHWLEDSYRGTEVHI